MQLIRKYSLSVPTASATPAPVINNGTDNPVQDIRPVVKKSITLSGKATTKLARNKTVSFKVTAKGTTVKKVSYKIKAGKKLVKIAASKKLVKITAKKKGTAKLITKKFIRTIKIK